MSFYNVFSFVCLFQECTISHFPNKCQKESSALRLFHSIVYANLVLRFAENQPRHRRSHQSIWRSSQHYHVCYPFHFHPPNHMELSVDIYLSITCFRALCTFKATCGEDFLGNGLITNEREYVENVFQILACSISAFLHSSLAPLSFFYLQQSSALCVHCFLRSLWLCTAAVFSAGDCNYGLLGVCMCGWL